MQLSRRDAGAALPALVAVGLALQIAALDQQFLKFNILLALQRRKGSTAARDQAELRRAAPPDKRSSSVDQGLVPSQKGRKILVRA